MPYKMSAQPGARGAQMLHGDTVLCCPRHLKREKSVLNLSIAKTEIERLNTSEKKLRVIYLCRHTSYNYFNLQKCAQSSNNLSNELLTFFPSLA
jgi:hypothetical protein